MSKAHFWLTFYMSTRLEVSHKLLLFYFAKPLAWRYLVIVPFSDGVTYEAKSTHSQLPRISSRPWTIQGHSESSLHFHSSSSSSQEESWDWKKERWVCILSVWVLTWETRTLVPLRGLCPFFGLVIHPNGLEIMTNHNNNSQLNKTSINRNNNWGWEKKWPLGILFWRDLKLWFPRQRRWQISQCDSLFLEKETNHIFQNLPVAKAVELTLLQ